MKMGLLRYLKASSSINEVKAILNKPCEVISVSLVLEAGDQIDMSTTQLSDCEISKIKLEN